MAKTATEELELIGLGGGHRGAREGSPGSPGGGSHPSALTPRVYVTGIWLALAPILMFFAALTSSLIVRKGLSDDWASFPLPGILWGNTAVLLASSLTLERARWFTGRDLASGFRRWWTVTTLLGILFLAGQLVAWRQLAAAGVFLATNPSSSFFYVLTATHGAHLLGGVVALLYVGVRAEQASWSRRSAATTAASIYWHFLSGLWVFIFLLLYLGR